MASSVFVVWKKTFIFCLFIIIVLMLSKSRFTGQRVVMKTNIAPKRYSSTYWNPEDLFLEDVPTPTCCHGCMFVVLILSAPSYIEKRMAIRDTWCQDHDYSDNEDVNNTTGYFTTGNWRGETRHNVGQRDWLCVFLIGKTKNKKTEQALHREMDTYNDILRGNYVDNYFNLTLKVFHGFAWVRRACKPNLVVKTDDDSFVNTKLLYRLLTHSTRNLIRENLYVGHVYTKNPVMRRTNKWKVKLSDYRQKYYPPYAAGLAYVLSVDVIEKMLAVSKYFKPLHIEDAFIGILSKFLKIKPIKSLRFQTIASDWTICNFLYLLAIHKIPASSQKSFQNNTNVAPHVCKGQHFIDTWE
ncbi:beta-1,3-galactosyltransferase 5-like [Argonauta hians]